MYEHRVFVHLPGAPGPTPGARYLRRNPLTHPRDGIKLGERKTTGGDRRVAIHLTPTELADEVNMKRREVISKCMEMGVPIFNGRIDKTLFVSSLRRVTKQAKQPA